MADSTMYIYPRQTGVISITTSMMGISSGSYPDFTFFGSTTYEGVAKYPQNSQIMLTINFESGYELDTIRYRVGSTTSTLQFKDTNPCYFNLDNLIYYITPVAKKSSTITPSTYYCNVLIDSNSYNAIDSVFIQNMSTNEFQSGGNGVTLTGISIGSSVYIQANLNSNYSFSHWEIKYINTGIISTAITSTSFYYDGNSGPIMATAYANSTPNFWRLRIYIPQSYGKISISGYSEIEGEYDSFQQFNSIPFSTSIFLTAVPFDNSVFKSWSIVFDDGTEQTSTSASITVNGNFGDVTVYCYFEAKAYKITFNTKSGIPINYSGNISGTIAADQIKEIEGFKGIVTFSVSDSTKGYVLPTSTSTSTTVYSYTYKQMGTVYIYVENSGWKNCRPYLYVENKGWTPCDTYIYVKDRGWTLLTE